MAYHHAAHCLSRIAQLQIPALSVHLPYRRPCDFRIICRAREARRECAIRVLVVRQPDIDQAFQGAQHFHPLIAGGIVKHRYFRTVDVQGLDNLRDPGCGRHKVNVVRALCLEFTEDIHQPLRPQFAAVALPADLVILAENTVQVTARKKDCSRALRAADTGFLPEVERRPRGKKPGAASAGTRLLFPIDATESRTELTGAQVQIYHISLFFPSQTSQYTPKLRRSKCFRLPHALLVCLSLSVSELKAALQRDNAVKDQVLRGGILGIHAEEAVPHELVTVISLRTLKVRLQLAVF